MAMSKALQAKEWREVTKLSLNIRYQISWDLPSRARNRTRVSGREASRHQPELSQPALYRDTSRTINTTAHAEYRKAQRNLSDQDINYVLLYGQIFHKAGAVITHLREKDIPKADQADQRRQKLTGVTVVMTTEGERKVLTIYRNRRFGLQHIKRKPNYTKNR